MTVTKKIGLVGRQFTVSGSPNDDYFRALPEGNYDDPVLTGLLPYIGDKAVSIDVGANIGLYSLALSVLAPGGKVYAFEPSPDAFGNLQKNLAQNKVTNVKVSQLALGDSTDSVRFHEIPFFTAGSFTVDDSCFLTSEMLGSTYFEAPCTTLDEFVKSEGIDHLDLIKVDVEGGEMSVIEGALQTIEEHRPLVVLEFSTFALTLKHSTLPKVALERLTQVFPYIFVIGRDDGILRRIATGTETYDFLYDNGIHGPVDNLLCCHEDLGISRGYIRLTTQHAEAALAAAEAEPAPGPETPVEPARPEPRTLGSRVREKVSAKLGR